MSREIYGVVQAKPRRAAFLAMVLVLFSALAFGMSACGAKPAESGGSSSSTVESASESSSAPSAGQTGNGASTKSEVGSEVAKRQVYKTRLCSQLNLAGPSFTFEYPSNWVVTDESCKPDAFAESVTITSDSGKTIRFAHGGAVASTSGESSDKVADVAFDASLYPDFRFPNSVAEYDRVGASSSEVEGLKLQVRRWQRPEQVGKGAGFVLTDATGGDPEYYGRIQFVCMGLASAGADTFTEGEEREIVEILSSLRQEPAEYDAEAAAAVANTVQQVVGTFDYVAEDGAGSYALDRWQINADGTAANLMRMGKDDYTWALTGTSDSLGRPVVRLTPVGNGTVHDLCYDAALDALCKPDVPEAAYTR